MKKIFLIILLLTATPFSFAYADASTTPDTTPPIITAPADQAFIVSTFPASPALTLATATDLVDPSPVIAYSPTSFPAGTTTVTWTATDAAGNSATTSSQVGVFLDVAATVDVPATCTATDTDAVAHSYPQADSPSSYLAICALAAALANGSILDAQLSNQFPSLGLFATTFNGLTADPNSQYWALYQNGDFANFGLTALPVVAGDTIALRLHDFSDNDLGSRVTITIGTLVSTTTTTTSPPPSGGGGGSSSISHAQLNVSNALAYLASNQHGDGSFDAPFLSDWAALAFAATDSGATKTKLHDYMLNATQTFSSVTDYERHALALEALGINPYSGTSVDSITPIVNAFDGTQIGDASLDNDDIFALFPLLAAGYGTSDTIIVKTTAFILSRQAADGSWDESVDVTAAAIQAIESLSSFPGVSTALAKAETYLHSQQQSNGGFGNSFATSWALQAISALNESPSSWAPNSLTPQDYLAGLQQSDGGVEPASSSVQTRVWATEYAIPAALGRTWPSLLQSFAKPAKPSVSGGEGAQALAALPNATTTPLLVSTSTTLVATSTLAITSTTTSVRPRVAKSKPKILLPMTIRTNSLPILADTQTAAVANAPIGNFFSRLWNALVTFFISLL